MNSNINQQEITYVTKQVITTTSNIVQDGGLKLERIDANLLKEHETLFDVNSLYCNEHKKLKKYYIRDGEYFLCEYDGYESSRSYCHFKDILLEYKEEVQRLKNAEISQADFNSQISSEKVSSSIATVSHDSLCFTNLLDNFQKGFLKRLEIFSRMNVELVKIKDILKNINFKDDGTVNFINIGADEQKELKILTLANILIRRKKGMGNQDINFTAFFIDFLRQYQAVLLSLARTSRNWIKIAIEEIYTELNSVEDNKFKISQINKDEFAQQIFFKDELEEIIRAFQGQLNDKDDIISKLQTELKEKNLLIESMRKDMETLTFNINERITLINQLNISIQEKVNTINEYNLNMNNLKVCLEEKNQAYNILFNERNNLQDNYNNLNLAHQKLILEFNQSKENFEKTIRNHILQIEEVTSIKKRLEIELTEERNKYKLLFADNEKGKIEYNNLNIRYEEAIALFNVEEHKYRDTIHRLESDINSYLLKIEQMTISFENAIKDERSRYNILLIEFEKLKNELDELNQTHQIHLVSASNFRDEKEEEVSILKNKYEKILNDLTVKYRILEEERNRLLLKISEYETLVNELNLRINSLTISIEELNIIIINGNNHGSKLEADIVELNIRINNYLTQIGGLEHERDSLRRKINDLEAYILTLEGERDGLLIQISNYKTTISELHMNIEHLNVTIFNGQGKNNDLEIQMADLKKMIEGYLIEIQNLKFTITELIHEKNELVESEGKLCDENDKLSDELEALKINHGELVLELKAQVKRNEILNTQLEELNYSLKSQSTTTEEITYIHGSKSSEFRTQYDNLILIKEKLENELIQRKNDYMLLQTEFEKLTAKYETSLNEISSVKEQLKTIDVLTDNNQALSRKVEELTEYNKSLESQISGKDNLILQLTQELNNLKVKNEELSVIVVKSKQSLESIQIYENKINALENTRQEIENLKKKIMAAEELNQTTRISRRSRSKHSKSVIGDVNMTQSSLGTSLIAAVSDSNVNLDHNPNSQRFTVNVVSSSNQGLHSKSETVITKTITTVNNNFNNITPIKKENFDSFNAFKAKINLNDKSDNILLIPKYNEMISRWLSEILLTQNFGLGLLFKASEDGFEGSAFRAKCCGIPHTVIVAKTNHGNVIGGYTSIMWEDVGADGFRYEEDINCTSFLYSFTLEEKYPLSDYKLAICNTTDSAKLGPVFGGGSDFEIVDQCNVKYNSFSEIGHSYDFPRKAEEFYGDVKYLIEEYEVYQVILDV